MLIRFEPSLIVIVLWMCRTIRGRDKWYTVDLVFMVYPLKVTNFIMVYWYTIRKMMFNIISNSMPFYKPSLRYSIPVCHKPVHVFRNRWKGCQVNLNIYYLEKLQHVFSDLLNMRFNQIKFKVFIWSKCALNRLLSK